MHHMVILVSDLGMVWGRGAGYVLHIYETDSIHARLMCGFGGGEQESSLEQKLTLGVVSTILLCRERRTLDLPYNERIQ